jgi:hypothetical protein
MPYERTRSLVMAKTLLLELLDSTKHPETTPQTQREIECVLRHYPEWHEINVLASLDPNSWSKVGATFDDGWALALQLKRFKRLLKFA